MRDGKASRFGLGLIIGALAGALAGLLYAPKKGEETRRDVSQKLKDLQKKFSDREIDKRVRKIFGKVTKEARDLYLASTKQVLEKVSALKEKADKIDRKKYQALVDGVVKDLKKTTKHSAKTLSNLRDFLVEDWRTLVEEKKTSKK